MCTCTCIQNLIRSHEILRSDIWYFHQTWGPSCVDSPLRLVYLASHHHLVRHQHYKTLVILCTSINCEPPWSMNGICAGTWLQLAAAKLDFMYCNIVLPRAYRPLVLPNTAGVTWTGNLLGNCLMSDCYYELCFLISLLAVKCIHVCSKPPYHVCMVLVRRISQYSCQVLLEVLSASFPQLVCDHAQQRAKLEIGFSAINSLYTFNPY